MQIFQHLFVFLLLKCGERHKVLRPHKPVIRHKNQSAFRIRRTLFDFTAFDTERGEFAEKVFVTAVNDFNIIDGADAFGT